MFGDRVTLTFELEVLSPLHAGTGEYRQFPTDGNNKGADYAVIMRDERGNPCIAGTALKGILRRLAEDYGLASHAGYDQLFGRIKDSDDAGENGQMGRMLVRTASWSSKAGLASGMPYASVIKEGDAFIAARTAIDGATGVADDHKLFFQEMIPAGAFFKGEIVLTSSAGTNDPAYDLLQILAGILQRDGASLGKGQTNGQGQIRLRADTGQLVARRLGPDGVLKETSRQTVSSAASAIKASKTERSEKFRLSCPGPFLVADSSASMGRDTRNAFRDKKQSGPQIKAQKDADGDALIPGSSVVGVLRARARWLASRKRNQTGDTSWEDAVETLFGTTDNRALLEIGRLNVTKSDEMDITSLRVDRFSGAPVDGALFTARCFCGVEAELQLLLRKRGHSIPEKVKELFDLLLRDLEQNGLQIGMGINKGFGWFTARMETGNGA